MSPLFVRGRPVGTHQGLSAHIKAHGDTSKPVGTHQGPWVHIKAVGTHEGLSVHMKAPAESSPSQLSDYVP